VDVVRPQRQSRASFVEGVQNGRSRLADSLDFDAYAEDMWRFKSKRLITHIKKLIEELAPWPTIAELDVTACYER
jgi:hypothetical protein